MGRQAARRIALASGVVPELSPEDTVSAAAAGGFDAAGLWVEIADWTASTTAGVRRRLADTGLEAMDVEVVWIKPGPLDPDHLRILDIGLAVGAANALVVSSDPDMDATAAKLAALCAHVAGSPLRIALEFGLFTEVKTIAAAAALLRAVDHDQAALLVDTLHLDRSGGTAADVRALPRSWFSYAQICDAPADRPAPDDADGIFQEAVYGRLLPGSGALDIAAVVAALPDGLPLSVELRSQALYDAWPDPAERARFTAAATRALLDG
jgi:sugar phosphate isomerase/epimerase